jgi:hypothetical protein
MVCFLVSRAGSGVCIGPYIHRRLYLGQPGLSAREHLGLSVRAWEGSGVTHLELAFELVWLRSWFSWVTDDRCGHYQLLIDMSWVGGWVLAGLRLESGRYMMGMLQAVWSSNRHSDVSRSRLDSQKAFQLESLESIERCVIVKRRHIIPSLVMSCHETRLAWLVSSSVRVS